MQDRNRIQYLIDKARDHCIPANDKGLADVLGVPFQRVSNWRTGVKEPSVETQCELAEIGNIDVAETALRSMLEAAEGERKKRLASAIAKTKIGAKRAPAVPLGWEPGARASKMLRQLAEQDIQRAEKEKKTPAHSSFNAHFDVFAQHRHCHTRARRRGREHTRNSRA